jgi:purine-binding chemotaxis protein CheW
MAPMNTSEQYCTFFLDDLYLAVEARRVHEVLRSQEPTEVPLADPALRGLINLRGHIVPVVDLRVRLGMPTPAEGSSRINVLIRTAHGPVSLLVDRVGDVQELARRDFEDVPETLQGPARQLIRGAFKLADRLLLSLDADRAVDVTGADAALTPTDERQ